MELNTFVINFNILKQHNYIICHHVKMLVQWLAFGLWLMKLYNHRPNNPITIKARGCQVKKNYQNVDTKQQEDDHLQEANLTFNPKSIQISNTSIHVKFKMKKGKGVGKYLLQPKISLQSPIYYIIINSFHQLFIVYS